MNGLDHSQCMKVRAVPLFYFQAFDMGKKPRSPHVIRTANNREGRFMHITRKFLT